jgi:hypothetical protein
MSDMKAVARVQTQGSKDAQSAVIIHLTEEIMQRLLEMKKKKADLKDK